MGKVIIYCACSSFVNHIVNLNTLTLVLLVHSPDSLIPLRLNAFATLLHTVSSAAHHMSKAGLRQLDGNATWDITGVYNACFYCSMK